LFAQRLDHACAVDVHEARDGEVLRPGTVYIAPGDHHLGVRCDESTVRAVVHQEGPENWVRPAVDVLFRGVADVYGERSLVVVLTGMGQDGIRGCERIRTAGGQIAVQDEATAVVWGMPGAVATAGLADHILPLGDVSEHLQRVVARGRTVTPLRPRTPARARS
jgi:two-component system chemotaxis response regulator CheB